MRKTMKSYDEKKLINGIWDILQKIHSENKFQELIFDLGKHYGYDYPSDLFKELNRTKTQYGYPIKNAKHTNHAKSEYIKWVQILHFVYKVDWEHFSVERHDIYNDQYKGESKIQWLRTEGGNHLDVKSFNEAYLNVCKAPLEKVEKCLMVYDYLGKTSFKKPDALDAYHGANSKLYSIIESKLTDGFEYVRFLALPLDLSDQLNNLKDGSYHDEALVHFIRFCPYALLVHIFNCFAKYPVIYKNHDPDFKPGFYIAPYTSRTHHFAVLDKKSTFGEYYRWNDQSIVRPDILFLETNNETSELLAKVYEQEIQRLLTTPHRRLKLHPDSLKNLSQTVLDSVQAIYNYLDALKTDPDYHADDDNIVYAKNELKAVRLKHDFIQEFFKNY